MDSVWLKQTTDGLSLADWDAGTGCSLSLFTFSLKKYLSLVFYSAQPKDGNSKNAAVSIAVDTGDSKAVDEALEGKPEESHG